MIRRASLELLVRGLFADDDECKSRKEARNDVAASKPKRDTWPWAEAAPAPEFVLC